MSDSFAELEQLRRVIEKMKPHAKVEVVANPTRQNQSHPIHVIRLGKAGKNTPTIGYFAGVHGLEQIGTKVLLSYMETIADLLRWDQMLHAVLKHVQLVFMPIVNPIGMHNHTRANENGVDLMRNAPVESAEVKKWEIYAGHRISPMLPWYRGKKDHPMEVGAQALCDVVKRYLFSSKVSIAVDMHSGFGMKDQLWVPYAHTRKPFAYLPQAFQLKKMLDAVYPYHVYRFEPQSLQYRSHGDVWDHLFDQHLATKQDSFFLPLCLEMGSWTWVRKNPMQLFSSLGVFNPIKEHRRMRTFRQHLPLFDFLVRAIVSSQDWVGLSDAQKQSLYQEAVAFWGMDESN
jgi:hypothetical protein